MTQVLDLVIKSDFEELSGLCLKINDFLDEQQLSPRVVYGVNLALEEVLTNILKYGYDEPTKDHDISVQLEVTGPGIVLKIVDDGHKFDVEQAPEPDTTIPICDRDVGGLGIHLVRNMLDSLRYSREQGKNILEITIKGEAASSGAD